MYLVSGNEKSLKKSHKLGYSNSFRDQSSSGEHPADSFTRDDELRHSTGSIKGHYVIANRFKNDVSLKYPMHSDKSGGFRRGGDRSMNGKRSGSIDSQASDMEDKNTSSHSVSQIIRGFESKGEVISIFISISIHCPLSFYVCM